MGLPKKISLDNLPKEKEIDLSNALSTNESEKAWIDLVIANKVPQGMKIYSEEFDEHFRLKTKTMVGVFGIDNVGKTTFYLFLVVCYARYHKVKFLLICKENSNASVRQKIIELYLGSKISYCNANEIDEAKKFSYDFFDIVDEKLPISKDNLFTVLDSLNVRKYFAVFIDPYNAIQYEQSPKSNYEFLDGLRKYQNKTGVSFHISMHISTDKARNFVYSDKESVTDFEGNVHMVSGNMKIPRKNFVEGGQPISNKLDDIIIVHRLPGIFELKQYTLIKVDKVKETQTGGMPTYQNPIMFKMKFGYNSFEDKNGVNPLERQYAKPSKEVVELPKPSTKEAF